MQQAVRKKQRRLVIPAVPQLRGIKIPLSLKIYKIDSEQNKFRLGKEYFYYKLKPVFAGIKNLRSAYMQTSIYR